MKETEALVRRLLERNGREEGPRQKVVRLWRDARLLQNSVRKLVEEMQAGGAVVELEERKEPGLLEMTIRVRGKGGWGEGSSRGTGGRQVT